jgi:hypothetical protein
MMKTRLCINPALPDTAVNGGKHGVISAYNQPL